MRILTIFLFVSVFVFGFPKSVFIEIVLMPIFLKFVISVSLWILYFGQCSR